MVEPGFISYATIKAFSGHTREISWLFVRS
jgi:hypothetical protein